MVIDKSNHSVSMFTKSICFYFLCLPLGAINIGAFGSLLKAIALIPTGLFLFSHPKIYLVKPVVRQLFLTICISATFLWTINAEDTWSALEPQLLFLILLISVSGFRYSNDETQAMYSCLRWSSRITAAIALLTGYYIEGRLALGGIISEDPNLLCAYFLFGIIAAVIELLSKPKKIRIILCVSEIIIYAYVVFSTGSRGGAIAILGALLIAYLLFKDDDGNKISRKLIVLIMFIILVVFALTLISEDVLSRYSLADVTATGGTHRIEIWQNAFAIFKESDIGRQLFGYGSGCTSKMFRIFGYYPRAMHNVFIQHLLEEGIIGLVVYSSFVASFVIPCFKKRKYFELAVVMGMLLLSLSTNIVKFKPYWNIQIYILCTCFLKDESEEMAHEVYR